MQAPHIKTAIPQRRYRLGDYQAVVLGEIESDDPVRYRYILALVREDESKPSLYVTAEKNPRARAHAGSHRLRVISTALTEELGSGDQWADLDTFATEGLRLAAQLLGLGEQPAERVG
jgi:hypothetical protein